MANNISFKAFNYVCIPYQDMPEQAPIRTYYPYPHYVPEYIKKQMPKIQELERTFPQNVEYSGDIYEKQKDASDKEFLYKASDGKEYSLKENAERRSDNAIDKALTEPKNKIIRCFRYFFREKLKIGYSFDNVLDRRLKEMNIIGVNTFEDDYEPPKDVNEMFKKITGFEYTEENAEKFLKGEIALKSEIAAEKYLKQQIEKAKPSPFITKYYMNERDYNLAKEQRTELSGTEAEKYNEIKGALNSEYQIKLENALKNGQLLQDNSDDKVTVLESLHKILTEPRTGKLDNRQILEECIDILDNPYIITQKGEEIPEEYQTECMKKYADNVFNRNRASLLKQYQMSKMQNSFINKTTDINLLLKFPTQIYLTHNQAASAIFPEKYTKEFKQKKYTEGAAKTLMNGPLKKQFFDMRQWGTNTCAAASVEYYLASEHTAQFFKIVEELTSSSRSFTKTVNLDKLNCFININSKNTMMFGSSSMTEVPKTKTLDEFKTKYKMKDDNNADITISPDKNAYFLAEIVAKNKVKDTRSIIDIIMQSAIMNLASRGTYESISSTRQPNKLCQNNCGLGDEEISYVLNTVVPKSLKYSKYKNGNIETLYKKEDMKNEILDALNRKGSVVAGYVFGDSENGYGWHEITIIGYTKNMNGDGFFIIQDSDDWESKPALVDENTLLDELDHAFI